MAVEVCPFCGAENEPGKEKVVTVQPFVPDDKRVGVYRQARCKVCNKRWDAETGQEDLKW